MTRSAEDLLQELAAVDESHRIEAKRASQIGRPPVMAPPSLTNGSNSDTISGV